MINYSKRGLTLLDVMIAVGLVLVGLLGIVGLLRSVIVAGRLSSDRFIAANLAQEGIEIVRSYRDSHWSEFMSIYGSPTFPINTPTDYRFDYNDNTLDSHPDIFLKLDPSANGFYNYDTGTPTKFKRTITLDPNLCTGTDEGQCIKVVSKVTWDKYELKIEDWLYNWKQ